jgi:hypothetical protein
VTAKKYEDMMRGLLGWMHREFTVGLYELNPVDPYLESAWFHT